MWIAKMRTKEKKNSRRGRPENNIFFFREKCRTKKMSFRLDKYNNINTRPKSELSSEKYER